MTESGRGRVLEVKGAASGGEARQAIARFQEGVRDPRHRIHERDSSLDSSHKYYNWRFSAKVQITSEKAAALEKRPAARPAAAEKK